jgi:hypothetical protein
MLGVLGLAGLLGACGSSDPEAAGTADAAAKADTLAAAPDMARGADAGANALVGAFLIELKPPAGSAAGSTSLGGKVFDGPTPSTVVWDLAEQTGSCQLLVPRAPLCSPRCPGEQACVETNQCAGYPTSQDLGTIQVRGLGAAPFAVDPIVNGYQLPVDLTLPFPPAAEGAPVEVAVSSGPFGAFTLATKVVAPLASTGDLLLERAKAIPLTWTAAGMPALARIQIKVEISHHGGPKGKIECDVADTGAFEVPAALVTKLIDLGVAGFPTVSITRAATGTATIAPGQVILQVLSAVVHQVKVAGYTSCSDDMPCPMGKVCQPNQVCAQ